MRLVARKVFGALWHDGGHKYIVTIDGVYSHTNMGRQRRRCDNYGWVVQLMASRGV